MTRLQAQGAARKITPFLWFDGNAEQAVDFYVSVFRNSGVDTVLRYDAASAQASGRPEGSVLTIAFRIEGQPFVALNGGAHFKFTEAVSFVVNCESQTDVDYYWDKLCAGGDPAAQRCGWLKDRFGLSWQIVPTLLPTLLLDPKTVTPVMQALLQMTRIDIAALQRAAAR